MVISNRGIDKSKELEIELKSIDAKLCGKGKGAYNDDDEAQHTDSDNEDGVIEGFDGFTGDINIQHISQIEAV